MRRELKHVQAEYEDIVKELEGVVEHLSWRGQILPQPHFTDAVQSITHPFPLFQSFHLRKTGGGACSAAFCAQPSKLMWPKIKCTQFPS